MARHSASDPPALSDEMPQLKGLVGLLAEMDWGEIDPVSEQVRPESAIVEVVAGPLNPPILGDFEIGSGVKGVAGPLSPRILRDFELGGAIVPIVLEEEEDSSCLEQAPQEIGSYQTLQQLLFGSELQELQQLDDTIAQQLNALQQQLHNPEQLATLLMPGIAEALQNRIVHSQEDIITVLAPIIDRVFESRIRQDSQQMGQTFSTIISPALSNCIAQDSNDVAEAISPIMGKALQKQIVLEEGAVVDALYPIIGGTISKYLAETVKQINSQIEDSLSVKGITRKIRAKIQGVSEAELILKEAIPFQVQALFLIHKASGLVIAESQPEEEDQRLEADMMAGMLTAIRSFANDCMTQMNKLADLNVLDYGMSKVLLEVTGSCYMAVVMQGTVEPAFVSQMRQAMGHLIQHHGDAIEQFEGDTEAVPTEIAIALDTLRSLGSPEGAAKQSSPMLMFLGLGLAAAIVLPTTGWQYYQHQLRQTEQQAQTALLSNPEVSVYNIAIKAHWGKLDLTGRVPNVRLRQQAEKLVQQKLPTQKISNQIYAIQMPVAEETTQAELQRLTQLLNQRPGSEITARFQSGHLKIDGIVGTEQDAKTVTQTVSKISGIDHITNSVRVQQMYLEPRIYFDLGSTNLSDRPDKLQSVIDFLKQYPDKHLTVIGYSKSTYSESEAAQLALDRANVVRESLIVKGVSPDRLQVRADTNLPIGVLTADNDELSRCVLFEVLK